MDLTRRQIIALSMSLLGLASSGRSLAALLDVYSDEWLDLLAKGLDRVAVGQLAAEFLRQNPEEDATRDSMMAVVLRGYDDREEIGEFLHDSVCDDFSNNRIVTLFGWRLSTTEGRILTLLATIMPA